MYVPALCSLIKEALLARFAFYVLGNRESVYGDRLGTAAATDHFNVLF